MKIYIDIDMIKIPHKYLIRTIDPTQIHQLSIQPAWCKNFWIRWIRAQAVAQLLNVCVNLVKNVFQEDLQFSIHVSYRLKYFLFRIILMIQIQERFKNRFIFILID